MSKTEQKKVIAKMLKERPPSFKMLCDGMREIYRWSGKAKPCDFILLKEHIWRVAWAVRRQHGVHLYLAATFHDCEEIYTSDIPSPIKALFPTVRAFGTALRKEIFKRINIPWPTRAEWKLITEADLADRDAEIKHLTENHLWLK